MDTRDTKNVNDPTIKERITALLNRPVTAADKLYIESFRIYFDKKGFLTIRQYEFFKSLEDRYSDAKLAQSLEWNAKFDDEKRKRLDLAFMYYRNTPYFSELVRKIALNPNFIPSENQYNSFCNNKYISRAIENYNTPPKYNLCDLVVFRKGKAYPYKEDTLCMIEHVEEKGAYRAGDRQYKLLIIGSEESRVVCEDQIKLYREKNAKD